MPAAEPSQADLEAIRQFIKKYPSGTVPPPDDGDEQPSATEPAPKPPPEKSRPGPSRPATKFFNVPSERAPDK
jgi:hypothetical protein